MRMLVYDCYNNDTEIMTVKTYNEAEAWKAENKNNRVKERMIDYSDQKPETAKQRQARLDRMKRVIKAIKQASM